MYKIERKVAHLYILEAKTRERLVFLFNKITRLLTTIIKIVAD